MNENRKTAAISPPNSEGIFSKVIGSNSAFKTLFPQLLLITGYIVITALTRAYLLDIQQEIKESHHSLRLLLQLIIPAYLISLHFYLLYLCVSAAHRNKSLLPYYCGLWLGLVCYQLCLLADLNSRGMPLPLVRVWPLSLAIFMMTTAAAISLSWLINKLKSQVKRSEQQISVHCDHLAKTEAKVDQLKQQSSAMQSKLRQTERSYVEPLQPEGQNKSEESSELITKLNHFIDQNMANPDLDCRSMAEHLCMSEKTLRRKLQLDAKLTPGSYLRRRRLEQARIYKLENKYPSQKALAYAVGFKSAAYFNKLFQQEFEQP